MFCCHQTLHEDDADPLFRAADHHPRVLLGRDLAERVLRAHHTAVHLRHQRRLVHQQLRPHLRIQTLR